MSNKPQRTTSGGMGARAIIALLAGLYTFSPIDAMPDFVPVLGQADDTVVVLLAVVIILAMTIAGAGQGGE